MQISQSPTLVPLPFADAGTKNTIPESASPTPGLASLTTGFPPITFTPVAAGGIPPAGADFNGVLNLITQSIRWANAGGGYKFNATFATDTNVDGYPQSAVILRGDGMGYWLNLADNNTTDPEGATPANWAPLESYGITAVTGLTNANVTLTPAQYGMSIITLAGTLTGNVQIIFPALKSQWKIVNATTGAFTVTCRTASGTGVIVNQGGEANVYGDGTNIVLNALQVAPATQSQHAVQLGQVTALTSGRLLRTTVYRNNAGTLQASIDGGSFANASNAFTAQTATTKVDVEVIGGGGGGGGTQATDSTHVATGSGGGGAGYARGIFTAAFSGVTVSVGAGGTSAAASGGSSGGTSSFGSLASASGGNGGSLGTQQVTNAVIGPIGGAGGGIGAGGQVNAQGGPGFYALILNGVILSGAGGGSYFGFGAPGISGTSGGTPAAAPGAGGSGGGVLQGSVSGAGGGSGSGGLVIVREYA